MNGRINQFLSSGYRHADAGYKLPNRTFKNSQGAVVGTFSHDFHL